MAVNPEEGERGAEKYLREVMGIVEEEEQKRMQQRRTRNEVRQEGTRKKEDEEGGKTRKKESEGKKRRPKPKLETVLDEEEVIICQGTFMVTKVLFFVSLSLFITSSTLLLSDYKQRDFLTLRQTVVSLPSFETPALLAKVPPLASIGSTAREVFVQVGWLGEDTWRTAEEGLLKIWERTEVVATNGAQLGSKLFKAIYKKMLVPALQWLQEPRRRVGPPQGQQQQQQGQAGHQHQQGEPGRGKEGGDKTGFPPPSAGPSSSDMEKQLAAKIAATTAYLNKEREEAETKKRKETIEEERKKTKEKLVERESSMEDFKRLQALRREAEGKR